MSQLFWDLFNEDRKSIGLDYDSRFRFANEILVEVRRRGNRLDHYLALHNIAHVFISGRRLDEAVQAVSETLPIQVAPADDCFPDTARHFLREIGCYDIILNFTRRLLNKRRKVTPESVYLTVRLHCLELVCMAGLSVSRGRMQAAVRRLEGLLLHPWFNPAVLEALDTVPLPILQKHPNLVSRIVTDAAGFSKAQRSHFERSLARLRSAIDAETLAKIERHLQELSEM